ncbi:hypothetical protein, partial [Arthrobacter nitrophenolicus]|uniref:hypothetical protein n=1 Tax=Arthrobacter nitrophenolicus TaxID=683150 RepID=UPI00339152CC
QGRHDPAIQPITLHNRYQQTWHTIEFSNNRHTRHHHQHHSQRIAPEQLFKVTGFQRTLQTSVSAIRVPLDRPQPVSGALTSHQFWS